MTSKTERQTSRQADYRRIYLGLSLVAFTSTTLACLALEDFPSTGLTVWLSKTLVDIINWGGYPMLTLLMALESACLPVPSEVVMPFSGYLVSMGRFDLLTVVTCGVLGNLLGSLCAYVVGLKLGRAFIDRYGRYILIDKTALEKAEKWFKKYGAVAVLASRVMPAVRTVISLPAGIGRMNLRSFIILTTIGSIPWNYMLTYLGLELGKNWSLVEEFMSKLDIAFILAIMLTLVYILLFHTKTE
ncbi:DedA family protein [Candidatus Bathyarchaeota archaeon]|nr:MAG: DedA family protein [Candidatus Bathyarchaeota archaeon]